MNILKFYPKKIIENYVKNLRFYKEEPQKYVSKAFQISIVLAIAVFVVLSLIYKNYIVTLISLIASFVLVQLVFYLRAMLYTYGKIKKMETLFPDVVQLMASNLRAGMTIDKAFLLSARPEFAPLDEAIIKAGKEISTGKEMSYALIKMGERIDSDKINKTIKLILSGIKSGGNISTLLEQTASNMRTKEFIEKRAQSSISMYVIFIFFAVAVGAPILFGLSTVLVQIITDILGSIPTAEMGASNLPFTFTKMSVSPSFILYFALIFLVITDIISSFVIGLVNKGDERYGLRYIAPLIAISLSIFLAVRFFLYKILSETFSLVF